MFLYFERASFKPIFDLLLLKEYTLSCCLLCAMQIFYIYIYIREISCELAGPTPVGAQVRDLGNANVLVLNSKNLLVNLFVILMIHFYLLLLIFNKVKHHWIVLLPHCNSR